VRSPARKYVAIALKLAATVALFWFVLSRVDLAEMVSRLSAGRIAAALLLGACVMGLQSLIAALRLQICAGMLGQDVSRFNAWTACQLGGLFSHTPMSFVGGDAMRMWHLVRSGVKLSDAAKGVLLDRALGFVGMMAVVLATFPGFYGAIKDPATLSGYLVFIAIGVSGVFVFIALGRVRLARPSNQMLGAIAEFATVSRYLSIRPAQTAMAMGLAILMSLLNGVAIWLIGVAYGAGTDFFSAMIASPVVFLVAMIPISVAGWGLREGAFVLAFGLFAVSSADALAVSITFGIAVLLAYSPAILLLLLARRRTVHASKEAGYAPASSPPTGRS
jgi:glycosyltransferase 2 family protein